MREDPLRHSTAHLMAAAILKVYPGTKIGIGPAIENGFYYDFEFQNEVTDSDLEKIEAEMSMIADQNLAYKHFYKTPHEAKTWAKENSQPYKLELIEELEKKHEKLSFYQTGEFLDLCEGPHVDNTNKIKHFKLLSIAGAYWLGDEKNPMLTRIYGTVFETKEELEKHLSQLEEAKKRDHKKLGPALGLFTMDPQAGPGLPLILPKGKIVINLLQSWARNLQEEYGYQEVQTPHIGKKILWEKSGHWDMYRDSMFPSLKVENQQYLLKPMNCPFHYLIYQSAGKSYRDLPYRLSEFGTVYRWEKSGELSGLLRLRSLTQDDAHIFLTEDQLEEEFTNLFKLFSTYFETLGLRAEFTLSLWDPKNKKKFLGDENTWEKAQKLLEKQLLAANIAFTKEEGEAAFYGPKIDPHVTDSLGRKWQIATFQVDFVQAKRFGLTYIDKEGKEKTPVIIHRAPLGAFERTLGILIEHYGGAFPVWLAPIQATIIPITDNNKSYAQNIQKDLRSNLIRVELDDRAQTMQAKIRDSSLLKIPYQIIVGPKEEEAHKIAVRTREGKDIGRLTPSEFAHLIMNETPQKFIDKKMSK